METAKCAYCQAERPLSELKEDTIIFQDARPVPGSRNFKKFVNQKKQLYCADKPCAHHDQCAHEG